MRVFLMLAIIFMISGCKTTQPTVTKPTNPSLVPNKKIIEEDIIETPIKKNIKHDKFRLIVEAPNNSIIKIMNIKPKYRRGILLKNGNYRILVKKIGYKKYDKWISINGEDKLLKVNLKKDFVIPKLDTSINWKADDNFAALYFDVFYEKNFFFAIPSVYSNNLSKILVKDYKNLKNCQRKPPKQFKNFLDVFRVELQNPLVGKTASLYRGNNIVGKLNQVLIDGKSDWRLPSVEELKMSKHVAKFQKMLCYDTFIGFEYSRIDFPRYYGKSIITYNKDRSVLPVIIHVPSVYDKDYASHKKGVWKDNTNTSERSSIILVKEATAIEKSALSKKNNGYREKIFDYVKLRSKKEFKNNNPSPKEKKRIYKKILRQAIQIVLGNPYLKNLEYNDKTKTMRGYLFSARSKNFKRKVSFTISDLDPKTVQDKLDKIEIIPLIKIDSGLNIKSVELIKRGLTKL